MSYESHAAGYHIKKSCGHHKQPPDNREECAVAACFDDFTHISFSEAYSSGSDHEVWELHTVMVLTTHHYYVITHN